jgi:hypothetical protein
MRFVVVLLNLHANFGKHLDYGSFPLQSSHLSSINDWSFHLIQRYITSAIKNFVKLPNSGFVNRQTRWLVAPVPVKNGDIYALSVWGPWHLKQIYNGWRQSRNVGVVEK